MICQDVGAANLGSYRNVFLKIRKEGVYFFHIICDKNTERGILMEISQKRVFSTSFPFIIVASVTIGSHSFTPPVVPGYSPSLTFRFFLIDIFGIMILLLIRNKHKNNLNQEGN